MGDIDDTDVLKMATGIISAFVANNAVPAAELPELIRTVHATIIDLSKAQAPKAEAPEPAVYPLGNPLRQTTWCVWRTGAS